MGSHQDGALLSGSWGRLRLLVLIVIISISSSFLSYTLTTHFARREHINRLEELTSLINSHRGQLEIRDVDARSLQSAFDSFIGSLESSASAAASSILPNSTTILNSLVSLITGGGNTTSLVDSLQQPANSLGVGLSTGALTGMNMTAPKNPAVNTTGLSGLALNLGSGLTSTIFSSSAVKGLFVMDPNQPGGILGGSTGTVGQAVLALAQGLGGGAVSGLKMAAVANMSANVTFNTTGVNGVAGNFGQGLSSAFLGGVQLPSLQSLIASFQSSNMTINVAEVGVGVGTGIGQGAVVGLGLQPDSTMNVSGVAGIAQGFTKGLVSSFLINGTAQKLVASFNASASVSASASASVGGTASANASAGFSLGGFSLQNINIAKVAEGFAVGLVSGAGSTVMSLQLVAADTTNFDDSVQGASTGFGRGLGTEGGKIVQMVLNGAKPTSVTTTTTMSDMGEMVQPSGSTTTKNRKRNIKTLSGIKNYGGTKAAALQNRAENQPNATDLASVLSNLNATAINPLAQYGIDTLTCTGIGGLVGVFWGLVQSKTIPFDVNSLLKGMGNSQTLQIGGQNVTLPDQTFIFKNEGNTYSLNPAQGVMTVMVNGSGINKTIALAVIHILFAIIVYVVVIPSLLLLRSNQTFTTLVFRPGRAKPPVSKWVLMTAYAMIPVALIAFGTGIGLRGNAKQFATGHGILGLIVILQTVLAGVTYPLALKNPQNPKLMLAHKGNVTIMLALSTSCIFAGITDLSSLAFCAINSVIPPSVWIAVGSFLTMQLAIAQGAEGLKVWLWWVGRKVKKGAVIDEEGKPVKRKIEKVGLVVDETERRSFKV